MRVAIIGKDSETNREALKALLRSDIISPESTVIVGVLAFHCIAKEEDQPSRYYARPDATLDDGFAYSLARRLAAMFVNSDTVIVLPEAGRMTTIEALFAKELNLPVWTYQADISLVPFMDKKEA